MAAVMVSVCEVIESEGWFPTRVFLPEGRSSPGQASFPRPTDPGPTLPDRRERLTLGWRIRARSASEWVAHPRRNSLAGASGSYPFDAVLVGASQPLSELDHVGEAVLDP